MPDERLGLGVPEGHVPLVHGIARLAGLLYAGGGYGDLLDLIGPEPVGRLEKAAWRLDRSWAFSLNFCPSQAEAWQQRALADCQLFRVRSGATGVRLLALMAPGDLMVNAPLDFIAEPAGLQLNLAFLTPEGALPPLLPDHDVAIVAASESAPAALTALTRVFRRWPRPILNDPQRILPMSRTWLPVQLAGLPGVHTAAACTASQENLAATPLHALLPDSLYPYLLRPLGAHAGHGLARVDCPADVQALLADTENSAFTLTQFVDYRGANGWYCKYRIAFVAGQPFICHMATSDAWMVHYLNAGMSESAAKRAAEAAAMDGSDGFLDRHAAGLDAVAAAMGLDYFSIDCAEAPDGRLLVFEADTAAIIHSMDSPSLFPYKRAAMQRCYDAFGDLVRNTATRSRRGEGAWDHDGHQRAAQAAHVAG